MCSNEKQLESVDTSDYLSMIKTLREIAVIHTREIERLTEEVNTLKKQVQALAFK